MGTTQSLTPELIVEHYSSYSDALFASDHWQGFEIDGSLQRFSGLNSTQQLITYRDQVLYGEGIGQVATVVEKLGPALGGLTAVPNAVGLGALIISMILETVAKSLQKKTLGTEQMIERVFAQEKAREVRDLMDEYLKQMKIHLDDVPVQLAVTREKKDLLSTQLTRLKNSMEDDGHMSTRALKQWVNGAAFHVQMLIHEARLERGGGSSAVRAAGHYQHELDLLLNKYKEYLGTAVSVNARKPSFSAREVCCMSYAESASPGSGEVCVSSVVLVRGCISGPAVALVMFAKPQRRLQTSNVDLSRSADRNGCRDLPHYEGEMMPDSEEMEVMKKHLVKLHHAEIKRTKL